MNKRDKNQGKVVRRSQFGKLDLRIILVRVFGEKKKRTKFIRIPCWMVSVSDLLVS